MDREELAALMRDRRFIALPVVDQDGRLLGIVKHDEVLEAVQEEAFGDLQKLLRRRRGRARAVTRSRGRQARGCRGCW